MGRPVMQVRIEMHDKLGALLKLGKIIGLFPR